MTSPATGATAAPVASTPVGEVAAGRRLVIASIAAQAATLAVSVWARLDPTDLLGSWDAVAGPSMQRIVGAGQAAAAAGAQDYVSTVLATLGAPTGQYATVAPMALVGAASDGRGLDTLLRRPALSAESTAERGAPSDLAYRQGRAQLQRMVRSEIADAGRVANGVAVVAAEAATGWVRMCTPPSCARCIILAGRVYPWNAGFDRHPHCDCVGIPAAEDTGDDLTTDPQAYFDHLDETAQNRLFTSAGAQAIRDGANIAQVVNSRLSMASMSVAGRQVGVTLVGARRVRGANRGRRPPIRLTPQSIYDTANGDRDAALRLLRAHGYLI